MGVQVRVRAWGGGVGGTEPDSLVEDYRLRVGKKKPQL